MENKEIIDKVLKELAYTHPDKDWLITGIKKALALKEAKVLKIIEELKEEIQPKMDWKEFMIVRDALNNLPQKIKK